MTNLKDLSREFVRNTVATVMSLMVMAIIYQQYIIIEKDKVIAAVNLKMSEMSERLNEQERKMAIEVANEIRNQVEIYKNRLLEIEQSLKKRKR